MPPPPPSARPNAILGQRKKRKQRSSRCHFGQSFTVGISPIRFVVTETSRNDYFSFRQFSCHLRGELVRFGVRNDLQRRNEGEPLGKCIMFRLRWRADVLMGTR